MTSGKSKDESAGDYALAQAPCMKERELKGFFNLQFSTAERSVKSPQSPIYAIIFFRMSGKTEHPDREVSMRSRKYRQLWSLILAGLVGASMVLGGCSTQTQTGESGAAPEEAADSEVTPETDGEEKGQEAETAKAGETKSNLMAEPWYSTPAPEEAEDGGTRASRALARKNQVQQEGAAKISKYYADGPAASKDYTIMIYMVGSNLESMYGAASSDLAEIEGSGISYDNTNVIVYTGGAARWSSGVPSTCNNCLDMSEADWEKRIVAQTEGSSDMGDPETLTNFITFCTDYYPARNYALILWDHGGGPVYGYGCDELFRNDSLLLSELKTAMDSTIFKDRKLMMVGFDACLMGSLESAELWSDYADYMVASEELEAGDGWDYAFLSVMNEKPDGKKLGSAIVDSYKNYYDSHRTEFYNPDYTLSCMDLSRADDVKTALDGLSSRLEEGVETGDFAALSRARSDTKTFGLAAVGSKGEGYDLIDLGDFADKTGEKYAAETGTLKEAISSMVVASCSNVDNTCGVSLYFPGDNQELFEAADDTVYADISTVGGYNDFISAYVDKWISSSETGWSLAEPVHNGDITLQLTPEQAQDMVSADYTLFWECDDGQYYVVSAFNPIHPGEDGVLRVPGDPEMIEAYTDGREIDPETPWSFSVTEERGEGKVYRSNYLWLSPESDFLSDDRAKADILLSDTAEGLQVLSVSAGSDDMSTGGKNTIDVSHYYSLWSFYGSAYGIGRNADGSFRPWQEWDRTDVMRGFGIFLDQNVAFRKVHVSDYIGSFMVQIQVTDANGDIHCAAPVMFDSPRAADYHTAQIEDETGVFEARVYGDHAAITGFEVAGDKFSADNLADVVIPGQVEGKPVTEISESAVASYYIGSIQIPDSVKTIGVHGLYLNSNLKEITLPAGLESISSSALSDCSKLEAIKINGESSLFQVREGVLFSADGKTLLTFPGGKTKSYTIPEGVEYIAPEAFAGSEIEEVRFPSTLKEVGSNAFTGCVDLKGLTLPSSLETIEAYGFGENMIGWGSMLHGAFPEIEKLVIPAGTTYIGPSAFTALKKLKAFETAPGNPVYASVDGFLTNKAGDVILYAPLGMDTGIVKVPEGITGLDKRVFARFDDFTEFYLPDSLIRIGEEALPEDSAEGYKILVHCSQGSQAEAYCKEQGIPYDNETTQSEYVTEEGTFGTYTYKIENDHAVFLSYKGLEKQVKVADRVKDLPVTVIGNGREKVYEYDQELEEALFGTFDSDAYAQAIFDGKSYEEANAAGNATKKDPFADGSIPFTETGYMESIELPETVTKISAGAFSNTGDLKTFEIPASVTEIGDGAFGRGLETITVAEGSESFRMDGIFLVSADGKDLIAAAVNLYDPEAAGLTRVRDLPEGKSEAEAEDWEYPMYRMTIPEGIERIRPYACNDISSYQMLLEIELPDSVTEIGEGAFSSSNIGNVLFGKGLKTIGKNAFYFNKLTELQLPDSVETIGDSAFSSNCPYSELILPDSLKTLGYGVFNSFDNKGPEGSETCSRVVIGKGLAQIDRQSFWGVRTKAFEVSGDNEVFSSQDGMLLSRDGAVLILCPDQTGERVQVPESVKRLGSACFYNSESIRDVDVPDGLVSIASNVFSDNQADLVTFHGTEGSTAQESVLYAGFKWESK